MEPMSIKQAMEKGKGKVQIRGWIYRERGSSKLKFVVLRDSTGIIQCVIFFREYKNYIKIEL